MFLVFNPIYLLFIIPVIIIGIIVLVVIFKSKGNKKVKIDEAFIKALVEVLGGKSNILNVSNENGRIKFELENLDLANLVGLKEMSQNGVFVTNNTVKTLFPHDAKTISNGLKNL